jgi:FkbM family methyltransferase
MDKLTIRVPESTFIHHPCDFILASTSYGAMILNRHDHHTHGGETFGVADQLLKTGNFEITEARLYVQLLRHMKRQRGPGVVALDIGANIGAVTVQLARAITSWGDVIAFEPQIRLFYALAGNVALGNHHNAHCFNAAIGDIVGKVLIPTPDYTRPGSFGSLELLEADDNEPIGQPINYDELTPVDILTIDSLNLPRLDLLKVDVEGMEMRVLQGSEQTVQRTRPIIACENFKTPPEKINEWLRDHDYHVVIDMGGLTIVLPQLDVNLHEELELDAGCGMIYDFKTL